MKFKKLTIQNFLSIHNISLDLEDRGLVLIKGVNKDCSVFDNNGAGKSSLIESLVYAIYGRTIRGLSGDAVVNNVTKKNMKIFLDLEDDNGTQYRIARYRKHSVNKNKSLLYRNGKEITPKSEADFNSYIADLLQADYLTFTSSILYSQESFKFTSATDSQIKSTFDLMLGLDVFQKCQEIAKNRIKILEGELSTTEWKITDREDKILSLEGQIKDTEEKKSEYVDQMAEEIEANKRSLEFLKEDLVQGKSELKKLEEQLVKQSEEENKLQKLLETKRKSLKQIDLLKEELQSVKDEISEYDRNIRCCESDIKDSQKFIDNKFTKIETYQKKIKTLKQKRLDLDGDIGQPCPTCGQPMTEESIQPARDEYDSQIADAQESITELQESITELRESIKKQQKKIDEYENSKWKSQDTVEEFEFLLKKFSKLIEEKSDCEEKLDDAKDICRDIESQIKSKNVEISYIEKTIKKTEQQIEKLQSNNNPYDEIIKGYKRDTEKYKAEIKTLKESIQDKSDQKLCLEFWQQAYSNQGIKSLILDDITPFLNRRVNKYLTKLTDGHIEVLFSTQSTLKSGEKREKFSISITNKDGGSEYIANSGGERKRVDLAINLGLQDLVASRSTKQIGIAIFDEIFDALDTTGIEKVTELLQELSKEKSSIFVISHNQSLQSYFDNVITVVKENGLSTLLGDIEFNVEVD